jgi:hypothetical protein
MRKWWRRLWKDEYTVAADTSPFLPEKLFRFYGTVRAKFFMHRWVWKHPCGQARLISGFEYTIQDLLIVARSAKE